MDMSVLLAITCDRNLVLYCMKSNVYDGLSTDLFTFSELPISHPVYYARTGTTVQGHKGVRGWLAAKKKYNRRGKNERFSPKVVCFLYFTHRSLKIDCQKNLLLVFLTKMPVRDDNGKKCATLERFL